MSGFPHNILCSPSEKDGTSKITSMAAQPILSGGEMVPSTSGSTQGSHEGQLAYSPRDDYPSSQFQYRPSSSSGDQLYRRDSAGSSAGSRPSTTASLNPTMQQLSTVDRLPTTHTLPPIRSVIGGGGRPASASESAGSAMTAANTLPSTSAWENRPRAASASSFTAAPSHRGSHLAGRYDRSILQRAVLPDRFHGLAGPSAPSSTTAPVPALTWAGSQRSSRAGPAARARSHSRPEPYAVPTGAPGVAPSPLSGAGSHRAPPPGLTTHSAASPTQLRAHTGLPATAALLPRTATTAASSSHSQPAAEVPSLEGFSREENGRRYKLVVVQSPSRARMCGFGDKDRRPLSPTLIVKLVITSVETGKEIPPTEVDTSAFLLAADLVHPEELKASPRNLLIHQHAATISTEMLQHTPNDARVPGQDLSSKSSTSLGTFDVDRVRARSLSDPWTAAQVTPAWSGGIPSSSSGYASNESLNTPGVVPPPQAPAMTTVTTETYTRNFVGASVASANILKDEKEQLGIFFVLQDLSVRTEGTYRIKLMFADLATSTTPTAAAAAAAASASDPSSPPPPSSSSKHPASSPTTTTGKKVGGKVHASSSSTPSTTHPQAPPGQMRMGISEALAETYTDPFVVYTPRRFPGVIEPTILSRKFAAQGVKIPVRVDRKKRRRRGGTAGGGDRGGGGGGTGGAGGGGGEDADGDADGDGDGDASGAEVGEFDLEEGEEIDED